MLTDSSNIKIKEVKKKYMINGGNCRLMNKKYSS